MKKNGLILISAATLMACAPNPPLMPYSPTPAPAATPGEPARAVEPAPARAEESSTDSAKPQQTADGSWRVSLISVTSVEKATRLRGEVEGKGYRVETEAVDVAGTSWQRLILPGYATRDEAAQMLPILEQELGISGAWVMPKP